MRKPWFYVWVATPSSAVGNRGFAKGDIDSLNIYTLATRDNLKFADGGNAAFSAPKTDANHPVFARGFVAGYCHQNKRWYYVEDMSKQVAAKSSTPIRLTNYWVPDSMQTFSVKTTAQPDEPETDHKTGLQRPNLTRTEMVLTVGELGEWMEAHDADNVENIYSNWKGGKKGHGFSRPEIRFLMMIVESLE